MQHVMETMAEMTFDDTDECGVLRRIALAATGFRESWSATASTEERNQINRRAREYLDAVVAAYEREYGPLDPPEDADTVVADG